MYLLWWDKPLNVRCGVRVYEKRPTEQPDEDVDGRVADPVGFWAALGDAVSKKLPAAIVPALATALAFGAIHCTGWSFTFPSSAERTLWRVASVSITAVPALLIIVAFVGEALDSEILEYMIGFMAISLYILSRLVLLLLPFLSLRSLPPAAYHVVHWTSLIPHV
ncbi:hypothetical protein F5148DRAFT_1208386 [Russula earlei]|uniref:Uncharacterized protein n=1 Tax=Russula earlei TaxID=71964 RepID=A0ACC0U5U4_9AGAM|nr:hypothetical protein F5148DRAFT_1208386 [Russula earlei]